MDVAKYIGLFLLKNNSCYIQGLGNIEWKAKPAIYDGRNLVPGTYEVTVITGGMADDSLSNFIATNEQISISRATTAVREFSTAAKADLQDGKEVPIPSLGNFYEMNGRMQFATAPYLQHILSPIPSEKNLPRRSSEGNTAPMPGYISQPSHTVAPPPSASPIQAPEAGYELPGREKVSLNWGRILLFILLLLFIYRRYRLCSKVCIETGRKHRYR